MKPCIVVLFLMSSLISVGQDDIDYKKKFDSLTVVHKVCILENSLRNHRIKMETLKKQKQSLKNQLAEIQSFKLRRTEEEKEEQLAEVNALIETNAAAYTKAAVQLTTIINDLVLANEDVKELQRNQ